MFHVGQKVVCIDSEWTLIGDGVSRGPDPKNGAIYHVAELLLFEDGLYLGLAECDPHEWFHHEGFRPITERKTDIEIFKRLLVPGTKILETTD